MEDEGTSATGKQRIVTSHEEEEGDGEEEDLRDGNESGELGGRLTGVHRWRWGDGSFRRADGSSLPAVGRRSTGVAGGGIALELVCESRKVQQPFHAIQSDLTPHLF